MSSELEPQRSNIGYLLRHGITRRESLLLVLFPLLLIGMFAGPPVLFAIVERITGGDSSPGTACMNNQRQIAVAIEMYTQDSDETLPAAAWTSQLKPYLGEVSIFRCPSEKKARWVKDPFCYGYNGNLLVSATEGLEKARVKNPDKTVLLADALPVCPANKGGGVLGSLPPGVAGLATQIVRPAYRHHGPSIIVAYVDGHVAYTDDPLNLSVRKRTP